MNKSGFLIAFFGALIAMWIFSLLIGNQKEETEKKALISKVDSLQRKLEEIGIRETKPIDTISFFTKEEKNKILIFPNGEEGRFHIPQLEWDSIKWLVMKEIDSEERFNHKLKERVYLLNDENWIVSYIREERDSYKVYIKY